MSQDKEAKDFELEDLEKPLTEREMKEAAGGGAPTPIVQVVNGQMVVASSPDPRATGQYGYVPPSGIAPPPPANAGTVPSAPTNTPPLNLNVPPSKP